MKNLLHSLLAIALLAFPATARAQLVNDGASVTLSNVTNNLPGSVVVGYKPEDWVRSIRHGVNPQGRALMVMPSEDYNRLTDDDLASLVAYLRHIEPASGGGPVIELPLPVRAFSSR